MKLHIQETRKIRNQVMDELESNGYDIVDTGYGNYKNELPKWKNKGYDVRSDIMDYINSNLDESCYSKKSNIKEADEFEQYTYVRSKEVRDSDGYLTEYTMYFDEVNDRYVFVFGDSDLYNPNDGYEEFDWECDSESEANDWFDDYEGFEDDLDEACNLKEDDNSYLRYKVKLTPYKNMFKFDFIDDYFDKSDYCFCDKDGYIETDYSGCTENFFNKLWNKDMKPNKVYGIYTDGPNGKVLYFKEIPSNWFK